jgi:hypothetical protein
MASAKATLSLPIPSDEIWHLIGGFGSLPDWVPSVTQSQLTDGGRIRHLHDMAGHTFIEQLEAYDRRARRYSYSIVASSISETGYLATIAVTPTSDGAGWHIEWSGIFTPVEISSAEAERIFSGIFTEGLKGLAARFTSSQTAKADDAQAIFHPNISSK